MSEQQVSEQVSASVVEHVLHGMLYKVSKTSGGGAILTFARPDGTEAWSFVMGPQARRSMWGDLGLTVDPSVLTRLGNGPVGT